MDINLVVLGFLMSGPKTGYKMRQISSKMLMTFNISLNQLYPRLRKLEERGFIKKEVVFQTDKPNKNVFSLTDEGRDYFFSKVTAPHKPLNYELDFLLRMLFFRFLEPESVMDELAREIESLQEQYDELKQMEQSAVSRANEDGLFAYHTAVHMVEVLRDWYQQEYDRRKARKGQVE